MPIQTYRSNPWRAILKTNFRKVEALCDYLELNPTQREKILRSPSFPLNLPYRLAKKIEKGTLDDPILRQFLPHLNEELIAPGFTSDPLNEENYQCTSRLLHKYHGRALIKVSSACAMHCRYCFRQHLEIPGPLDFLPELQAIAGDHTLSEIILSGGDPLSLDDQKLQELILALQAIPHVKRLRFHTRFPIGIPERITDEFLQILETTLLQVLFVIHVNHASELDEDILSSLRKLRKLGIPLLSQSVLLKGVNDSIQGLKKLFETLVDNGIIPYYLHQLDPVSGASAFEVEEHIGKALMDGLAKVLSGYALPRYVREIPGAPHKVQM